MWTWLFANLKKGRERVHGKLRFGNGGIFFAPVFYRSLVLAMWTLRPARCGSFAWKV